MKCRNMITRNKPFIVMKVLKTLKWLGSDLIVKGTNLIHLAGNFNLLILLSMRMKANAWKNLSNISTSNVIFRIYHTTGIFSDNAHISYNVKLIKKKWKKAYRSWSWTVLLLLKPSGDVLKSCFINPNLSSALGDETGTGSKSSILFLSIPLSPPSFGNPKLIWHDTVFLGVSSYQPKGITPKRNFRKRALISQQTISQLWK